MKSSKTMTAIAAIFVGSISLLFGAVVSISLIGFGICGSELTIGATVAGVAAGIVTSLIGFVAIPPMRAAGASLFSLPLGFAIFFMLLELEWLRCLSILICISAAHMTVWLAAKGQYRKKSRTGLE